MEQLMSNLKRQIIDALNLKHLKPDDIGDEQPLLWMALDLIQSMPSN